MRRSCSLFRDIRRSERAILESPAASLQLPAKGERAHQSAISAACADCLRMQNCKTPEKIQQCDRRVRASVGAAFAAGCPGDTASKTGGKRKPERFSSQRRLRVKRRASADSSSADSTSADSSSASFSSANSSFANSSSANSSFANSPPAWLQTSEDAGGVELQPNVLWR